MNDGCWLVDSDSRARAFSSTVTARHDTSRHDSPRPNDSSVRVAASSPVGVSPPRARVRRASSRLLPRALVSGARRSVAARDAGEKVFRASVFVSDTGGVGARRRRATTTARQRAVAQRREDDVCDARSDRTVRSRRGRATRGVVDARAVVAEKKRHGRDGGAGGSGSAVRANGG